RGLPDDHPSKAVNVNCGEHYERHYADADDNGHSFYFADDVFLTDLAQTLSGDRDRSVIGRRRLLPDGRLALA
ncbi:MAG: hypothetical protein R3288_10390, partial [Woeseiaceae bacterium]|nr:hypothetical protein [Woeseiaceae bacterium]